MTKSAPSSSLRSICGNGLGWMAEIGVHAHEDVALGALHAVEHRRAEPAVGGANDDLDPLFGARGHELGRSVAAVVVHDEDVKIQPVFLANLGQPADQVRKVFGLLVGRNHDRDPRKSGGIRRAGAACGFSK
jgi:hypothetical protein